MEDASTTQAQAPVSPPTPAAPIPQKVQPSPLPPSSAVPLTATKSSDRLFASPLAKRLAAEQGIDLKVSLVKFVILLGICKIIHRIIWLYFD